MIAANARQVKDDGNDKHSLQEQTGLWLLDGEIARLSGKLDEAVADFRKAQLIDPTDQVSRNELKSLGG